MHPKTSLKHTNIYYFSNNLFSWVFTLRQVLILELVQNFESFDTHYDLFQAKLNSDL